MSRPRLGRIGAAAAFLVVATLSSCTLLGPVRSTPAPGEYPASHMRHWLEGLPGVRGVTETAAAKDGATVRLEPGTSVVRIAEAVAHRGGDEGVASRPVVLLGESATVVVEPDVPQLDVYNGSDALRVLRVLERMQESGTIGAYELDADGVVEVTVDADAVPEVAADIQKASYQRPDVVDMPLAYSVVSPDGRTGVTLGTFLPPSRGFDEYLPITSRWTGARVYLSQQPGPNRVGVSADGDPGETIARLAELTPADVPDVRVGWGALRGLPDVLADELDPEVVELARDYDGSPDLVAFEPRTKRGVLTGAITAATPAGWDLAHDDVVKRLPWGDGTRIVLLHDGRPKVGTDRAGADDPLRVAGPELSELRGVRLVRLLDSELAIEIEPWAGAAEVRDLVAVLRSSGLDRPTAEVTSIRFLTGGFTGGLSDHPDSALAGGRLLNLEMGSLTPEGRFRSASGYPAASLLERAWSTAG